MTFAVGNKLGPYEIIAPIGGGGTGEVCRARDQKVGCTAVVNLQIVASR